MNFFYIYVLHYSRLYVLLLGDLNAHMNDIIRNVEGLSVLSVHMDLLREREPLFKESEPWKSLNIAYASTHLAAS